MKAVLALLAIAILIFTNPVSASAQNTSQNVDAEARYSIKLKGFGIATADIDLKANNKTFLVDVNTRVSGLASLVASGKATAVTKGVVRGNRLRTSSFNLETKANKKTFNLGFQNNSAGNVVRIALEPRPSANADRVNIRAGHKRNVIDPMSAFVIKAKKLDRSICQRTARIFTGLERYDLKFSFAGVEETNSRSRAYTGPLVACNIRYVPISGHFGSSQMTRYMRENQRFTVWFAPLENGNMVIPYKVLIGTQNGDLTLNLRRLKEKTS